MTFKKTIFIIVLLLLVAGAGYYFYTQQGAMPMTDEATSEETMAEAEDGEAVEEAAVTTETATDAVSQEERVTAEFALSERIIGNPDAPIKISEHSSLTCGHCGQFHREIFADFKTQWIDSGKAYLVFSDFPLNAPALHASVIARCLPKAEYFGFIDMLFATQDDWAYKVDYLDYLKTEAGKRGLDAEGFTACLQNGDIQKGVLDRVRATQAQWKINSTPSFVINNKGVISGALPIEDFSKAIEAAVALGDQPAPAAAPDEATTEEAPITPEQETEPAATEDEASAAPAEPVVVEETVTEEVVIEEPAQEPAAEEPMEEATEEPADAATEGAETTPAE